VMDRVREVCSVALSIRKAHARRVRLPLSELTVSHSDAQQLSGFIDIIADEVNVKKVSLSHETSAAASAVLQVNPGALGPRLGGRTQDVIKSVKSGDWRQEGDRVFAGDIELFGGEYSLKMAVTAGAASAALGDGLGMVTLNIEVTPELAAEGTSRDLIRLVQQARREAGLEVSDRITLTLGVPEALRNLMQPFLEDLSSETLATSLRWADGEANTNLDGEAIFIGVERASISPR